MLYNRIHLCSLVILCSLLVFPAGIAAIDSTYSISSPGYELVVTPADYEIVPNYGDGVITYDFTWVDYLERWDVLLFSQIAYELGLLDADAGYIGKWTRTIAIPTLCLLLGLPFLIIFSRRNNPERNAESTAACILTYIQKYPGSSLQQIVSGIEKSRGSVSYQLMRFEKERKIRHYQYRGRIYYFTTDTNMNKNTKLLYAIFSDKKAEKIFLYLLNTPKQTISDIGKNLGLKEETVYYYLQKMGKDILKKEGERNAQYSIQQEIGEEYETSFRRDT